MIVVKSVLEAFAGTKKLTKVMEEAAANGWRLTHMTSAAVVNNASMQHTLVFEKEGKP